MTAVTTLRINDPHLAEIVGEAAALERIEHCLKKGRKYSLIEIADAISWPKWGRPTPRGRMLRRADTLYLADLLKRAGWVKVRRRWGNVWQYRLPSEAGDLL